MLSNPILLTLCSIFLFFAVFSLFTSQNHQIGPSSMLANVRMRDSRSSNRTNLKRWIVVTSVQYPTDDIKGLTKIPGWNVVVVGDAKSPADWNATGVHYLSIDEQNRLDFTISSHIPTNSYTRKNIGYLYAIAQRAEWIYDTDDDNKPYGAGLESFDYGEYISGLRYTAPEGNSSTLSEKLFNPYKFFGRPKMWPRGFPLESIQGHSNDNNMMLCARMRTPAVQQGLVHNDPDVDAIYRLLNADRKSGLSEGFNPYAPPIQLDKNVYAPWNSQNTLFHRRAFFTLFLPTTVSFRTTDIWRSYFAQRLLHLAGESVGFYPANAIQHRNAHDYLKDFHDENAVYEQSGRIVTFLDEWDCIHMSLEKCMIELADEFVKNKFWGEGDAKLIRTWIEDLKKIGYIFPPIGRSERLSYEENLNSSNTHFRMLNCRRAKLSFFEATFAKDETSLIKRAEEKIRNWRDISHWCAEGNYTTLLNGIRGADEIVENHRHNVGLHQKLDMALVVVFNWPWKAAMGLIQRMYEPYFATVIFCGTLYPINATKDQFPGVKDGANFIHLTDREVSRGYFIYQCLSRAHQLRLRNIKGFMISSDDVMYHHWHPLDESVTAHAHSLTPGDAWWGGAPSGELLPGKMATALLAKNIQTIRKNNSIVQGTWKEYEKRLKKNGVISSSDNASNYIARVDGRAISDWFYVPSNDIDFYQRLTDLFVEARMFLEIAVGKYLRAADFVTYPTSAISLWGGKQRGEWVEKYNKNLVMLHPVKFSQFGNLRNRKVFCEKIAQLHVNVTLKFEKYENAQVKAGCATSFLPNSKCS